jgi:hypothetical protein
LRESDEAKGEVFGDSHRCPIEEVNFTDKYSSSALKGERSMEFLMGQARERGLEKG